MHLGHAGHTADQNHVLNVCHVHACIFDSSAARRNGAFNQLFDQAFKLGAGEFDVQVTWAISVCRDVGQVHIGRGGAGEFNLGFFSSFFEALQGQHIFGQVHALVFFELRDDEVDDALVKVFATQESVAVGGEHLKLHFAVHVGNFNDGHVKSATTQVIHRNFSVALATLVQAKGQRSCRGFVDDALDVQPCNAARVFGGLALGVIKVGRYGNHGFGDFFA